MDSPQMPENRLDSLRRDWLPQFGEDPASAVPIPPGGLPQERDARDDRRGDLLHRIEPVLEETILDLTYPVPLVLEKERAEHGEGSLPVREQVPLDDRESGVFSNPLREAARLQEDTGVIRGQPSDVSGDFGEPDHIAGLGEPVRPRRQPAGLRE